MTEKEAGKVPGIIRLLYTIIKSKIKSIPDK